MADRSLIFDTLFFTIATLFTIGFISALIAVCITFISTLELTELDISILVWLIVAFCVSTVILFSAFYLICCNLKSGKLILTGFYTAFDLFILLIAVAIFAFRPSIVTLIGQIWSDESQSSIEVYLEEKFNCCGFNQKPNHDCKERIERCKDVIERKLERSSGLIGGILIGAFVVFLGIVIVSFIRALKKGEVGGGAVEESRSEEIRQFQDKLAPDAQFWF
jgi:hypothetical protein